MDVWVVAAAAGAGYVGQQLKNLNRSKRISCEFSSESRNLVRPDSSGAALKVQESLGQELYRWREQACDDGFVEEEAASTSGSEGDLQIMMDDCTPRDVVYESDSSAELLNSKDNHGEWKGRVPSNIDENVTSDAMSQPSSRDVGLCYRFRGNRSAPRCQGIRSKIMKPRTSLESCLMAQVYKEHAEFEECICSVHPPQEPILRSFRAIDGSRIVSRTPHEYCSKLSEPVKHELCDETYPGENKLVVGIPKLPNVVPVELWKRAKAKTGTNQVSTGSNNATLVSGNQNNAQVGLPCGTFQFFFGLTVGIIYSFLGSKRELERMRKSLTQSENLVQDLQDELEMKDALTVKELSAQDHESLDVQNVSRTDDAGQALSLQMNQDNSSRNCGEESGDQNADEESLRKIEAELEAELHMLESNMKSSRLEGQLSNLANLDPNFVSDVVEGELRADLFGVGVQAYADRDGSNRSTPHYAQYPVSPRELSLRLHEVIQSRLEERVQELEMALQQSRKKLSCLESYHIPSQKDLPNHKTVASPNPESTFAQNAHHSPDRSIIINLSWETPAACNGVYSTKLSESDEEESKHCENFHQYDDDPESVRNGSLNDHMVRRLILNGSQELVINNPIQELSNDGLFNSRDESEDDDEIEKLLIRQIVEKARQGSPALLNAQIALLSADLN